MQSKELNNAPEVDAIFPYGVIGKPSTEGVLSFIVMTNKIEVKKGDRYGRLTIIKEVEKKIYKRFILCKCDCGNETTVRLDGLMSKKQPTKSCGCLRIEIFTKNNTTHGLGNTRVYNIYAKIIQRCFNPNNPNYKHYGGRGITMCAEWKNDFNDFYDWAMENGYKERLTIDRIDNDGNYEPDNCRWATTKEQARNRRGNINIKFNGRTMILKDWAKEIGISSNSLQKRLNNWSLEKALTESASKKHQHYAS